MIADDRPYKTARSRPLKTRDFLINFSPIVAARRTTRLMWLSSFHPPAPEATVSSTKFLRASRYIRSVAQRVALRWSCCIRFLQPSLYSPFGTLLRFLPLPCSHSSRMFGLFTQDLVLYPSRFSSFLAASSPGPGSRRREQPDLSRFIPSPPPGVFAYTFPVF